MKMYYTLPGIWIFGRNINMCLALYKFNVSDFLADRVDVNAVMKQHCCIVVSKDHVRGFECMHD